MVWWGGVLSTPLAVIVLWGVPVYADGCGGKVGVPVYAPGCDGMVVGSCIRPWM